MASPIKKATFDDLFTTLQAVANNIDRLLQEAKELNKDKAWSGYPNFKSFLKDVEVKAIKGSAKELNLGDTTVRDRWKVLTLPTPVFDAIESGQFSFSKVKPLVAINFDFENDKDIEVAEEILNELRKGLTAKEIKEVVKEKATQIWNGNDIVVKRLAEQNGIAA